MLRDKIVSLGGKPATTSGFQGAWKKLIEETAAAARQRGVERLYWNTQQFNGAARSLYDTVGQLTSMVVYERKI